MRALRIITGLALLLAIIGVGLGAYIFGNFERKSDVHADVVANVRSLTSQITALQAKVKSQGSQITTAQNSITGLQDSSTAGQVSQLKHTVSHLSTCLPELQTEIGGLGIDWSINGLNTNNDSFSIDNPTIVSNDCSSVLYGG